MDKLSSLVYDIQAYDDMPKYEWDPSFNMDTLAVRIEDYNDKIFRTAKKLICAKLHIEYRQTGWKDYLTRRLRRMVHGPDLDKVMEKQITLPLCLSDDFERTMTRFLDEAIEETDWLPQESKSIPPIIQMHTEGVGTEIVPDLIETLESEGNMRIWVISNELMWAGVDRRIDEVFEVLWTAYHWLSTPSEPVMDGDEMIYFFGTRLRTRYSSSLKQQSRATIISGDDADQPETPTPLSVAPTEDPGLPYRGATARRPQREQKPLGVLSPQEAQYFQSWVFCYPEKITRHYTEGTYHELYDEGEVIYPPPDELFWSSDDQEAVSKNYLGVKEWKSFKMTETEATDAAAISPRHSGFSYGSAGCAAVGDAEDLRQRLGMKKKGVPKTTGVAVDIGMEDFDLDDSGSEDGGLAASPMDVSAG
ncbi:MAG: hypothetical protein M1829_004940 [Trizodia sp. TS-e1964]|nr:MAG: hypothetical protein M1829_004940 [Trizodia sp. TS-e1964]